MSIAKQLLLIAIINCGLLSQVDASQNYTEEQEQRFTKFTTVLSRAEEAEDRKLATWANKVFTTDQNLANQLVNDVNTSTSFDNAKEAVKHIYIRETTPQQNNEGYFSNISTRVKAAAAALVIASIASYFYFMHPWGSSNQ
jgi:hypothetical protein